MKAMQGCPNSDWYLVFCFQNHMVKKVHSLYSSLLHCQTKIHLKKYVTIRKCKYFLLREFLTTKNIGFN